MVLAAPHHESGADAHHMVFDVDHAGLAPCLEDSIDRPAAVEILDVGTEKAPGPPPRPTPQRITRGRHDGARVDAPARAPECARRHEEVETRHATRGPKHPRELSKRGRRVGHIAQQVRERDGVERLGLKRQLLGARVLEPDPVVETRARYVFSADLRRRLADVDPNDFRIGRGGEGDGDAGGAGRDVKDATRPESRDVMHQRAAPLAVLAQRQNLRQAVVFPRQILEETRRKRILRARLRRAGFVHARLQGTGTQASMMLTCPRGRLSASEVMAALVELSQHRIRLLPDLVPEPGEPHLCASVFEQDVVDAAGASVRAQQVLQGARLAVRNLRTVKLEPVRELALVRSAQHGDAFVDRLEERQITGFEVAGHLAGWGAYTKSGSVCDRSIRSCMRPSSGGLLNRFAASRTRGSRSTSPTLFTKMPRRPIAHQTARSMSSGDSKGWYHVVRL